MVQQQQNVQSLQKNVRFDSKDPIDLYYMRRVTVRHQKRQLILVKLSDFPEFYIQTQCLIMFVIAIITFSVQVAIIVTKTELFYICSGFWVSLIYLGCICSLYFMKTARSYGSLIVVLSFHLLSIVVSIGGLIIVNAFDMALFNTRCINACDNYSYQYLNLIMLIFGTIAVLDCLVFIVLLEYLVLKESRNLNVYLGNRK